MADKLFQARVDERTAKRLLAYAKAAKPLKGKKKMTESELVQYALDLVIDEADRQLAALQQKVIVDAQRTARALQGDSGDTSTSTALRLGPGVPAGGKTFQATIKDPKSSRLHAIGRAYNASDSELVRRGFKLIIDETVRNQTNLLHQLHADYLATRAALVGADGAVEPESADEDDALDPESSSSSELGPDPAAPVVVPDGTEPEKDAQVPVEAAAGTAYVTTATTGP